MPDDPPARTQLSSWYTQGPSDGFGDRLLMFDNAATGPLELLRVRADFALVPEFEARLRARLDQLSAFAHRGFAPARAVNHLDNGEGLTVVSTHVAGTRLSDLFPTSRPHAGIHPALARWALGELTSALAALHRQGPSVAHGALAPDRVVITADRHMVVTDWIFGDALARMDLPAERLWAEFGIVSPHAHDRARLDQRGDVVQLALIVLSLVLGRRVTPEQYPQQIDRLLEECAVACERQMAGSSSAIRTWIEQALEPNGFPSAVQAELALLYLLGPAGIPGPSASQDVPRTREALPAVAQAAAPAGRVTIVPEEPPVNRDVDAEPRPRSRVFLWVLAALAVIGIVQGAVIARLVFRPPTAAAEAPPTDGTMTGPAIPPTVATATVGTTSTSTPATAAPATPAPPRVGAVIATSRSAAPDASRAAEQTAVDSRAQTGGVRIVSPIPVQVVEGERILGFSSNGPIFASAGSHELDLINNALGFRSRQTVRLVPGRVISLDVTPPDGRISINAQPWAQVSIDGKPAGETPLANLSVPVGEHEVVFRHPQLGERRQKVTVQAGTLTRVSASFTP